MFISLQKSCHPQHNDDKDDDERDVNENHDVDDEKTLHISLYPRKPASLVIGPANDVLLAAAPIPGQKCCIERIERVVYGMYTHM